MTRGVYWASPSWQVREQVVQYGVQQDNLAFALLVASSGPIKLPAGTQVFVEALGVLLQPLEDPPGGSLVTY